nr:probable pectate lyase 12 [Tanacetum cinerariifolium]
MPGRPKGYLHVITNVYPDWEMYAIGGSENPATNNQGNRYTLPANPNVQEVACVLNVWTQMKHANVADI